MCSHMRIIIINGIVDAILPIEDFFISRNGLGIHEELRDLDVSDLSLAFLISSLVDLQQDPEVVSFTQYLVGSSLVLDPVSPRRHIKKRLNTMLFSPL